MKKAWGERRVGVEGGLDDIVCGGRLWIDMRGDGRVKEGSRGLVSDLSEVRLGEVDGWVELKC